MKKVVLVFSIIILIPFLAFTQIMDSIDYISPFFDEFASVRKGSEWAIINKKGTIVIDFRDDLVSLKRKNESYPVLTSGRCLIKRIKDEVTYFGYIDKNGNVVIDPQFINATNFKYDKAIVTKLIKIELGYNKILEKPVVSYKYQEIVIDRLGEIKVTLTEQEPISYLKPFKNIPKINSKIISKDLVITKIQGDEIILKKIK